MATQLATAEQANGNGTRRTSLIEAMAEKYNLEPKAFFQTVKATVFDPKATQEELIAFLTVANRYNLDPFCGEVFAFRKQGGGIQAVVGVDGWSSILNSHPQMDGMEFVDKLDDKGELIAVTCRIYRRDRKHPTECTEYMSECKRGTIPWKQWPRRMLRHKATIQCARLAFGLTGLMDPDEAERTVSVQPAAKVNDSKLNEMLAAMPAGQGRQIENQPDADQATESRDGVDPPAGDDAGSWLADLGSRLAIADSIKAVSGLRDEFCGPESQLSDEDREGAERLCKEREAAIRGGRGGRQGSLMPTNENSGQ